VEPLQIPQLELNRLSTVTSGVVRLSRVREAEAQAFTLDWRMAPLDNLSGGVQVDNAN
jgi:hypothetical protein